MKLDTESLVANCDIHENTVVPACEPWSRKINQGEILRLVDLEGQQAVDFLCYNADNTAERYNVANTIKLNKMIYISKDVVLWSVKARKMMTVIEDTCGQHDTLAGCCSIEIDKVRYDVTNTQSCQTNFESELKKHGMDEKDVAANINFFMNVPVDGDGSIAIAEGVSKAGDYVDLRAEMDLLVVISNCPQCGNPCSGFEPTRIQAIVYSPPAD